MRASEATPLNHSRWGDPEYCCSGEPRKHNYHFRPGATRAVGALIWCCCKSVLSVVEPETVLVCASCGKPVERTFDDDWQHTTLDDGLACTTWPVRPVRTEG